ncbi:hypothetical protein [Pseudomonas sp. DWP3-1-2]|uniref:hypothetical protein n=1 Tax=Pseudomonas sp. DWP3-1-2 TaxID=2804645 RepID=UPI003CED2551
MTRTCLPRPEFITAWRHYSAVVDPCDLGVEPTISLYPPVAAGDDILKRIDDSMAYRKKG